MAGTLIMMSTLFIIAFFLPCCLSVPVIPGTLLDDLNFFKDYFQRFFFSKEESETYFLGDQLHFLQHFFKLKESGYLDEPTKALIWQPRCGMRDIDDYAFFPGRPRIENNPITYRILNYPEEMSRYKFEKIVRRATKIWSSVTPLEFQGVYTGDSDIQFAFLGGYHGDGYPFDGKGNVLAHAFAPNPYHQGAVHFDSDEDCSHSEKRINLFQVAVHEIGYSLGLIHSQNPDSIMYPKYKYRPTKHFKLSKDDIEGIETLYTGHNFNPFLQNVQISLSQDANQ